MSGRRVVDPADDLPFVVDVHGGAFVMPQGTQVAQLAVFPEESASNRKLSRSGRPLRMANHLSATIDGYSHEALVALGGFEVVSLAPFPEKPAMAALRVLDPSNDLRLDIDLVEVTVLTEGSQIAHFAILPEKT